jgi:hypothetical protein
MTIIHAASRFLERRYVCEEQQTLRTLSEALQQEIDALGERVKEQVSQQIESLDIGDIRDQMLHAALLQGKTATHPKISQAEWESAQYFVDLIIRYMRGPNSLDPYRDYVSEKRFDQAADLYFVKYVLSSHPGLSLSQKEWYLIAAQTAYGSVFQEESDTSIRDWYGDLLSNVWQQGKALEIFFREAVLPQTPHSKPHLRVVQ